MNYSLFVKRVCPVVMASIVLLSAAQAETQVKPVDSIVAVVNDEVITSNELQSKMRRIEAQIRSQKNQLPPTADLQRQVLERMILERAQLQVAKDAGIRVDDSNLDRAIARVAESNQLNVQQLRDQIEKDGISFADYREEVRTTITILRLRDREVDNKIVITDAEVDNYLASESIAQQTQQEYNLAQILIRIPENASPEVIASRRARAEEVLAKVNAGGDFAKLAATYSDATDALSGGDLGWRSLERLPQLFVDAILKNQQGQVTPLVKSPNGFHILKVLGKRSLPQVAGSASGAPVQTHARHILIKVNQLVSQADAKRKLNEVRERLQNKAAKFEDLAKTFSNDGSAAKGGDLGWLYPGDTVPEFEKVMDSLAIGQVSEPVETPFGFHLIEVLERKTEDKSAEGKRQEARQALRLRKLDEGTEDWARQLRDRAYVEIRLDAQ